MRVRDRDRDHWRNHGWVILRGALADDAVADIDEAARAVESWAGEPGLAHFEETPTGTKIARSEDFDPHQPELRRLMRDSVITDTLTDLLGEPAVLFKEKINYKHPGGGGFAPHQDITAYPQIRSCVSVMVPLDAANPDNGCLWFTRVRPDDVVPHERGTIDPGWCDRAEWVAAVVEPGDVVFFDGLAPHRSDTNTTTRARRALYLTYNPASEGDHRAAYYVDKRRRLDDAAGVAPSGNLMISLNDDFLGKPVAPPREETPVPTIRSVIDLLSSPAADHLYDEVVTEREHALQSAELAVAAGHPAELVAACLLHDVGHLLVDRDEDHRHQQLGADHLAAVFPDRVTAPIALHVDAKRYLCATEPGYFDTLSPSSVTSLAEQGGPMTPDEVTSFEALPHAAAAVELRRIDDRAKIAGRPTRDVESFADLLHEVCR